MIHWEHVRYFTQREFQDPDVTNSGDLIDGRLLLLLDKLRHETGWPIIPHWQVGGCVDVNGTHGHAPHSYHLKAKGCKAVDFHFNTTATPRYQYYMVSLFGFPGLGVYYDWHWNGELLPLGFHVDLRPRKRTQRWARRDGHYTYLLWR